MGLVRLFLALGVVLEHANHGIFAGSYTAVQAFFIISGFYMSLILSDGRYDTFSFLKSRALRIYPAYFAILAFALATYAVSDYLGSEKTVFSYYRKADLSLAGYVWAAASNALIVFSDAAWFIAGKFKNIHPIHLLIIVPAWTLSLEIVFYLFAPFLVRRTTRTLLILVGIIISARAIGYGLGLDKNPWHSRFIGFEMSQFILGMISYRAYATNLFPTRLSNTCALLSLPFIFFFYDIVRKFPLPHIYSADDFIHSIALYAIIIVGLPSIFSATKRSKLDRYIGEYSYPVYLIHYALVANLIHTNIFSGATGAYVVTILSVAISAVVIHFVQIPIDRYRHLSCYKNTF